MDRKKIILLTFFILIAVVAVCFFVFGKSEKKINLSQPMKEELFEESVVQIGENENEEVNVAEKAEKDEAAEIAQEEVIEKKETVESGKTISATQEKKSSSSLEIKNKLVSSGFAVSSSRKIDTIILHSSYNSLGGDEYSVDKIIEIYKSYGVSAHYLIGRDGQVLRLVEEKNVAYHAGVSEVPDGRKNVNDFSIGIEMVGNKTDGYAEEQYDAVSKLVGDIKKRHEIKYILGHKDIAPTRKDDPWNFDFSELK